MNGPWKRTIAAAITALILTTPALGVGVMMDGTALSQDQAWVDGGVSYITLRSFSELAGYGLSWDGTQACLTGTNLALDAKPGEVYISANGRALYVGSGVQSDGGVISLPMGVVAEATGATLRWDSATATAVLETKTAQPTAAAYHQEDLYWLSRIISSESQGESLLGQIAVGNVVLNRVKSSQYPNSIKGVVFDQVNGVQFEPVSNGTLYETPSQSAVLAAKLCLEGANVVDDCMYFYAPALSQGTWIVSNCTYYTTIGNHCFYR